MEIFVPGVSYVYHVGRSQTVQDQTKVVQCGIDEFNCNFVLGMPRTSLQGRSDRLIYIGVLQLFGSRGTSLSYEFLDYIALVTSTYLSGIQQDQLLHIGEERFGE